MSWVISWTRDAENALTEFWLISPQRQQISASADEAELMLARNPETCGDYLSEDLWSLDRPPLRFHYVMDATQRIVTVVAVSMRSPR